MSYPPLFVQTGPKTATMRWSSPVPAATPASSHSPTKAQVLYTTGLAVQALNRVSMPVGRPQVLDLLRHLFGGPSLETCTEPRYPCLPSASAAQRPVHPFAADARNSTWICVSFIFAFKSGAFFEGGQRQPSAPMPPALPTTTTITPIDDSDDSDASLPELASPSPKRFHYTAPSRVGSEASGIPRSGPRAFGDGGFSTSTVKQAPLVVEPEERSPDPLVHPEEQRIEEPRVEDAPTEEAQTRPEPAPAQLAPAGIDYSAYAQVHTDQAYVHGLALTQRMDGYTAAAAQHKELARKEAHEAERHNEEARRASEQRRVDIDRAQQIRHSLESGAQSALDADWAKQQLAHAERLEQQAVEYTGLAMQHGEQASGRQAEADRHTALAQEFEQQAADAKHELNMP